MTIDSPNRRPAPTGRVRRRRTIRPGVEAMEGRVAMTAGVALASATTFDSRFVVVGYTVDQTFNRGSVDLAIYRSADAAFDGSDLRVGGATVGDPGPAVAGVRTVVVGVPDGLTIDPARPFVLAVAEAAGEPVDPDDVASFRKYVVGAVAHGLDPLPIYVGAMAESLRSVGYDAAVPFFWSNESVTPAPGLAVAAGQRMADQVIAAADALPPGSVVDLHLIGHSRGSVVIAEAMRTIVARAQAADTPGNLRGALAGWSKLTFLDPHPAHNVHETLAPVAPLLSTSPGPMGRFIGAMTLLAQAIYADPEPSVPFGVDESESFFQHNPYYAMSAPFERLINIWGEAPIAGVGRYYDLTGGTSSHYTIPYFYLANVVPTLRTAGVFAAPSSTPSGPPPSASPRAFERSVLVPALTRRRSTADELLRRADRAASALERGDLALGLRRARAFFAYTRRPGLGLNPAASIFLRTFRPVLDGFR